MAEGTFNFDETRYIFPSEINLFSVPDLTNTYTSQEFIDFRPATLNLNSGGSIDFVLPGTINSFTSLRETRLHTRLRILAEDGSFLDSEDVVAPTNWPACTLFEGCQIFLNQTLVTSSGGLDYGYRSIISALVDKHRFQRDTELQLGLYEEDSAGYMQDFTTGQTAFMRRWSYFAKSEPVTVIGPITDDLAEQNRLILSNTEIVLKFHPARAAFCLNSASEEKYKVEFLDCFLRVCRKVVQPAILVGISNALDISPARYPYMKTEFRKFIVQRGLYSFSQDLLYDGTLPSYIVISFVTAKSYSGQQDLNPYDFIPAGVSAITLYINDKPVTPGFKMTYDGSDFLRSDFTDGLESLYRVTSGDQESELPSSYCQIRRDTYTRGYCLYLVKFNDSGKFLPVQPHANLKINVEFRTPPEENLQLLLYARFPSLLTIDKTRRVTV